MELVRQKPKQETPNEEEFIQDELEEEELHPQKPVPLAPTHIPTAPSENLLSKQDSDENYSMLPNSSEGNDLNQNIVELSHSANIPNKDQILTSSQKILPVQKPPIVYLIQPVPFFQQSPNLPIILSCPQPQIPRINYVTPQQYQQNYGHSQSNFVGSTQSQINQEPSELTISSQDNKKNPNKIPDKKNLKVLKLKMEII